MPTAFEDLRFVDRAKLLYPLAAGVFTVEDTEAVAALKALASRPKCERAERELIASTIEAIVARSREEPATDGVDS
jgi:hypothetical protein